MKISGINKVTQAYKSNINFDTKNKVKKSKKDALILSSTAKDVQIAKMALKKVPDVRMDKINPIKQRIESGTYNIDAKEIANKMIKNGFDYKS